MNYHGFAAKLLDRYGMLAGIEPDQRVLSPAQRTELCARVMDLMTFEHVKTETQGAVIDNILLLDDQASNHRRTPDEIIAFNEERLKQLQEHRSDRAYHAALERIELARGAAIFRQLKRDLGAIDFGDQISLALKVVEEHPQVAAEYRQRFGAVLLDEYQDTNVAQAKLIAGVFGGGHPVTAVGDPDQNIYAWRGASLFNLLDFPQQFRSRGRFALDAAPAVHELPLGRADPGSGGRRHLEAPRAAAPGSRQAAGAVDREQDRRGARRTDLRRVEGGASGSPSTSSSCTTTATSGRTSRCSAVRAGCSSRCSKRSRSMRYRWRSSGWPGCCSLPEIVEVLAYARAVSDPLASVALAKILLGPRYRVGYKDLARVAALAKTKSYALRLVDEEEGEATPFLFAEALEHLDEVERLSDDGKARLEEFRAELADLRVEARKPVGEFLGEVVRRTGILAELDAHTDQVVATAAKRNLAAFMDQVHAFEPVEGELTLRAFLDYVDTVERMDKQEWSPVQPSAEDSVKVMTIHAAKGLEFDNVFVPGMAKGLLPSTRIQHNPAERGKSMDFELRGDAKILPKFDGVLSHFKQDLQAQEEYEERRTAYVAMTRARRRLFCTGAHWYGENMNAKEGGKFLRELAEWVQAERHGTFDPGADIDEETNPLLGYRERFVKDWPEPARPDDTDEVFPDGWRRSAVDAVAIGGVQPTPARPVEPGGARAVRGARGRAAAPRRVPAGARRLRRDERLGRPRRRDAHVSVGGVIDYARCPKRFYWTAVRPLPRFSGPAARIGTEVHRWIERRASGQAVLLEVDEAPDLTSEELAGEPGKVERLREAFLGSRFADVTPLHAERPFLLRLEGFTVGGRIDAVYGDPDGPWEVVDWKTGRRPADDDRLAALQLDLYGLACVEIWGKRPEDVTLTYLYLASGDEVSHPMGAPDTVKARVTEALRSIDAGAFQATPGPQCTYCDFRAFCPEGKSWWAERRDPANASADAATS